ncbi:hypothetical protein [Photobacterium sp. GB-72]|uniref:hypothetical protein n=1 Tax=Photobacterium sp. GB-72 TaxID=2022105 RepID=UPI000D167AA5|nr:hypothetical protein [Photobacterium sp. GB-72]PSV28060.1 hypothetical protein C9J40_19465 [Photobacterium sp. GB-72]
MKVFKKVAACWLGICISTSALANKGLPNIQVAGLDQTSADPFQFGKQLGGMIFTLVITFILAIMAFSTMRNAWAKYHETGDDGSRANMGAVAQQILAGVVLIICGIFVARWGYESFGIS